MMKKKEILEYTSTNTQNHKNKKIYNYPIEKFIEKLKINIKFSKRQYAQFAITDDIIQMPFKNSFMELKSATRQQNYYITLFHEVIHWSGHTSRLNRKSLVNYDDSKKDEKYLKLCALEELTAEIGANILMQTFDMQYVINYHSLSYINRELRTIEEQEKIYNKALKQAILSYNYLFELYEKD